MHRAPQIIFFDCWYTLFEANFIERLRQMAALLSTDFDRTFVKNFEQDFMTQPSPDLHVPATAFVGRYAYSPTPDLVERVYQIIREGEHYQRAYPDTLAGLTKLRQNYKLGLITNSWQSSFERLRQTFNLEKYFDMLLPTYEIGTIKPDRRVFETALERVGLPPEAALMVGDSPDDDVEAAREMGIRAILLDRRNLHPDYPDRVVDMAGLIKAIG